MATAREYAEVLTFTRQDVYDALMVQSTIYFDGVLKFSDKTIITKIATVTGFVATFIKKSKVLGIISTISALLDVWLISEKEAAEALMKKGVEELTRMLQYFDQNPNFTMIRYRVPFIEFNNRGDIIRLQSGKPVMLAAYDKRSGWLDA